MRRFTKEDAQRLVTYGSAAVLSVLGVLPLVIIGTSSWEEDRCWPERKLYRATMERHEEAAEAYGRDSAVTRALDRQEEQDYVRLWRCEGRSEADIQRDLRALRELRAELRRDLASDPRPRGRE